MAGTRSKELRVKDIQALKDKIVVDPEVLKKIEEMSEEEPVVPTPYTDGAGDTRMPFAPDMSRSTGVKPWPGGGEPIVVD